MALINKKTIFGFLLLFISIQVIAKDPYSICFNHIGLNNGLSQSTVFSIAQDRQGNLWFATYDGINKYDGYNFTVYRHKQNDPTSIANDISRVVTVDSRNRLWIGTRSGLSLYDRSKDLFRNYSYTVGKQNIAVNAIFEYTPGYLLLSTNAGLLMFQIAKEKFYSHLLPASIGRLSATHFSKQNGNLYIGTDNGLFCYSTKNKTVEYIRSLGRVRIQYILPQNEQRIWIATEGNGLYLYNPANKSSKNYRRSPSNKNSLISNYIRSLAFDRQNRLWIGTYNGLSIYNENTDNFSSYINNPIDNQSLSQNSVKSIFMDSQGGMWLGTYFGGLNYYHPLRNRFEHLVHNPFENSISDNVVSCMVEDRDHNLWIGTNNGGLDLYHPGSHLFTHYPLKDNSCDEATSNDIKTVFPDPSSSQIYVGAHAGGLCILQPASRQIKRFNTTNSAIPSNDVYAILPDMGGDLWIGTLMGLAKFNKVTQQFTPVRRSADNAPIINRITTLFKDNRNRLWIGSENGLQIFNVQNGSLQRQVILPREALYNHSFVNCIYEAKNGIFWIGTRNGLFGFNERNNQTVHYSTEDVLPNNVVYGILEDSFGRLWISTNKGICCFNPRTRKARNYTEDDGLQSNQFNNASFCRTLNGEMFFGGVNGISTFRPELITDNPYTPKVVITELSLFNKTVRPDDETGILEQNICDTKKIVLNAYQTSFTLGFVVSNYIAGKHNTFSYTLDGYDSKWYTTNDLRQVSYSNLPQGHYVFKVKAANNDGKWNEEVTTLDIVILPIWYKTWWAILLFIIALGVLAYFIFRFLWIRKSMQAEIEMERKEKEHQEAMSQMKIRFYVNIFHELRTPLTLIISPLQEIMNKINDRWVKGQLTYVYRNANRLLHLVNQMMDYRRAELGIFELKLKKANLYSRVLNNFIYYDQLAKKKEIDYNLYSDLQDAEFYFDGNYLDLILNNLLSNAFKYTHKGDRIYVRLNAENNQIILQVSDTGIGIPKDKQSKIFERFYQVDNDYAGSGIGLSLVQRLVELHHGRIELKSEVNEGSTFTIYIPQDKSVYAPNEFASDDEETDSEIENRASIQNKERFILDTESEEDKETENSESKRGTILIVEDNQEIRKFICDGLKDFFTTLEAEDGEKALEVLKNNEIDLVVTDIMMPVMDGITLCKQIKQNIRTCHIPVYMLSAKSDLKDQMEGLQVGADDYIPKPFSISILTAKIQNTLRTRYRLFEKFSNSMDVEPEKITTNAMDEELIKKAVSIVEKNMDNVEFSTDQFAKEMGMSRSNLHLKLKAITGQSAIDFIHKIRFGEACRLLKEGRYNISEISYMVGYNTPSYFATRFKKYVGCLPTEYVKQKK
jgi:ligand-binding sensor domain-containing protein/signal transduction histidine kinase/DNA-binding response OmpR family regulator